MIERHHSSRYTPSLLYPESYSDGNWRIFFYEKVCTSLRQPPQISLKHDWMKELVSKVARHAEGSQPTEPNPNPNHDRTVRPVVIGQLIGSSSTFNEVDHPQRSTRWTSTSEYLDCHIQL